MIRSLLSLSLAALLLPLAACGASESPEDAANGVRDDAAAAQGESDRASNAAAAAHEKALREADARGQQDASNAISQDDAYEAERQGNRGENAATGNVN